MESIPRHWLQGVDEVSDERDVVVPQLQFHHEPHRPQDRHGRVALLARLFDGSFRPSDRPACQMGITLTLCDVVVAAATTTVHVFCFMSSFLFIWENRSVCTIEHTGPLAA